MNVIPAADAVLVDTAHAVISAAVAIPIALPISMPAFTLLLDRQL